MIELATDTATQQQPRELLRKCFDLAVQAGRNETAALIHWNPTDRQYELRQPVIESASEAHVTYRDESQDDLLVYDFHSHGSHPAFFPATDDASDMSRMGPYIAMVAGKCDSIDSLETCARMCMSPYPDPHLCIRRRRDRPPGHRPACLPGFLHEAAGPSRLQGADVGNYKALVLTHRINAFYGFDWGYRTEKGPTRPGGVDLVISCTDLAMFRAAFSKDNAASTTNALWLDFGNGNAEAQCVLGHLSRKVANRIPNVVDLYPELSQMQRVDAEQPSCSADEALRRQPWPINREIAMKGVGMLWSLLRD
ncbi:hypothetical protein SM77512_22200, partial [Xanthomonas hortorum pv. gardneri]|uniref:Mov34/MPN/PAD-1 family protein n=1 Tax=Xanthomonas hortorum TaxID=56454 RepID=UPI00062D87F6